MQKASFNFGQHQSIARLSYGVAAVVSCCVLAAHEFYEAANQDDFTQGAFNLTDSFIHRLQKHMAELPDANVPQRNHSSSSSNPTDSEEKIRKQRSAFTATFKDPKKQFGGNLHEDYDDALDSYYRLAEERGLDLDLQTNLVYKAFRDGA
jgi:hypothetical protein